MARDRTEFKALVANVHDYYGVPLPQFQAVYDAYMEPWRAYHNYKHILGMIRGLDDLAEEYAPNDSRKWYGIAFMVIYHDVWFKVGRNRGENEYNSAEWAVVDLELASAPLALVQMVKQGILATITHDLSDVDPIYHDSVGILLDLDLYGLGQSYDHFQGDTEAIWKEFQPVYTRDDYDAGRSKWAANFLKRERIYYTPAFEQFELQARANLERLATSLAAS